MIYLIPPELGCLLGLILIVYLIGAATKSAGRKMLDSVDTKNQITLRELWRRLGPLTWQEYVAMVIIIALTLAILFALVVRLDS